MLIHIEIIDIVRPVYLAYFTTVGQIVTCHAVVRCSSDTAQRTMRKFLQTVRLDLEFLRTPGKLGSIY